MSPSAPWRSVLAWVWNGACYVATLDCLHQVQPRGCIGKPVNLRCDACQQENERKEAA